jgi:glycosyltransferase involved in cell wall biosynthesis
MKRYLVITPARDEESHLQKTISAVAAQTMQPAQWIIVDDGSRDSTGSIVDRAAEQYPWITAIHRRDRGFRQSGGGVVATFNDGYSAIKTPDWEFIVKLDADLTFAPDYFERCFAEFDKDLRLGIGGGGIYHETQAGLELEQNPRFHVRGATKIYRRECWQQIGGLVQAPGWDTIDEVKANMMGWSTRTFPNLKLSHARYTGAADGAWKDSVKNGFANYVTGYHPAFMFLKCARRLFSKPYLVRSFGLWCGFVKGYFKRAPRVGDPHLIKYVRSQQIKRLLRQESIWQ